MRARVDAALTLDVREVPPKVVERLCRMLSFPNPAYLDRLRLGLNPGAELETVCFVEQRAGELRLPRGAIHVLRRAAAQDGLIVACDDARVLPDTTLDQMQELPLRDYQQVAVDKLAKVTQGTVVIPCGGGKTRVGMGAIANLRTPTLVLVHTLDLAEQWLGELKDKLGLDAGLIGDGEAHPAPVTVAVIQALVRWEPAKLDAFLAGFGLLILDEAHHVAASTFHSVVDRCPARYRLGLTATPEREDGLTALLELFLGGPLVTVTHDELVAAGVLTVPEIHNIETDFTYLYTAAEDYAPMLAAVACDGARNALIVRTVVEEARAGHICLVLSGRIDHCHALADAIAAEGVAAAVLTGEVKRAVRKEVLDEARAGKLPVIVATSLADEGLDLPRLSRVFLAHPGRARGRTVQRLGRLMRPHADKTDAALFDFVDRKVPLLRRHHLERRKLYAEVLGVPASKLGTRKGAA
ncbi:DEAD/DEAH box helicase [Corallococcus exiguus]|uniref:DEAD/DEAH box helicase n=1 Tax=Corallococcus exiguus TaxID=83462 RepID=UPI0014708D8F|nr:DEAD/DEAH box helicase [Corallococcus exiguus]NNB92510.1 DEAD/DEAH box helicase [Corallococcus exiguus]NNC01328.1 DEAD/DEAH box helicase [Corallococcus exiguus]